jgi:hypothetical protein
MDIKHRINVNTHNIEILSTIQKMGVEQNIVKLPGAGGNLITIFILESDPRWNEVISLVKEEKEFELYGKGDQFESIFSNSEIREADFLRLISTFEQGYPQPESTWPLKQNSLDNVCSKCGIYNQTNKIRINKEPNLKDNSFMSLIGIGECFCVPYVITELKRFEAKGFQEWNVIVNKTDQPSKNIQQLYIPAINPPGMIPESQLLNIVCPVCGTKKYLPHIKGKMRLRKDSTLIGSDFMLTNEWFGTGLIAYREIIVSNRIANFIIDRQWKGVRFKVIELV